MEHQWHTCKEDNCRLCELSVCSVCGGMEGDLTTDCPDRRITAEESDRIYKDGDLDFRDGKWVNEPNPTHQMWKKTEEYRKKFSL